MSNRNVATFSNSSAFLWLSDLHLDPYYGSLDAVGAKICRQAASNSTQYGQRQCDSPKALIRSALQHVSSIYQQQGTPFDFILVTGDFSRHGTDSLENPVNETRSILSNVTGLLLEYFSPEHIRIIPSIGNNDCTPDYYMNVDDNSASATLNMIYNGFEGLFQTQHERFTLQRGGYLAVNVTDRLTVLSLNTILYSSNRLPRDQQYNKDPLGQFEWLKDQLDLAQTSNRSVYIIGHIPPAVGSWRHTQLWQDDYLETYYTLIQPYQSTIQGQLFGHLHSDEFRLINVNDSVQWPLLLASSISPMYGANPSFRVVSYDEEDGILLDYDSYYFDLTNQEWKMAPSFRESFKVENLSASSLGAILANMTNTLSENEALWETFLSRQHVYANDTYTDCFANQKCRGEWICTIQSMSRHDYDACMQDYTTNTAIMGVVLGIVIASIAVVMAVFLVLGARRGHWCRRRRHYETHLQEQDQDEVENGSFDVPEKSNLPDIA